MEPADLLTDAELLVIEHLRTATNSFCALPEHHSAEIAEWVADVHRLQEKVMCRAAIRAFPDRFTAMELQHRGDR